MKIKIKHCTARGPQFENLKDGSIHEVIAPPPGENDKRGWREPQGNWIVMIKM